MAYSANNLVDNPTQDTHLNVANNLMLQDFFGNGIKYIYHAEKQILETLPKMIHGASSPILKTAFEEHMEVSNKQVARLERVFELSGKQPAEKKCEAIQGIIKQGEIIFEDSREGTATRDIGLILAAQKVEHYEIASYSGLAQLATTLGMHEAAALLTASLDEEKEADAMFSDIALHDINYKENVENCS
jgi:ferritin-like metal-binding protein YciE